MFTRQERVMVNEIKRLRQDHEFWHSFYKSMGKEDLFILKFWDGFDNFHDYVYETYPGYEKPLKAIDVAAYRRELEETDIDPVYGKAPFALRKKDYDTLIRRTQVDLIDRED
jgi:hypothetical protein